MIHKKITSDSILSDSLFKMRLILDKNAWHGYESETIWVRGVGGERLQVCNSPFFFKGLSYMDWVIGEVLDGELTYKGLAGRGGHSTFRLVLMDDFLESNFLTQWGFMKSLGCSYESIRNLRMYSIDVPEVNVVSDARGWLNFGLDKGFWDYDEGFVAKE